MQRPAGRARPARLRRPRSRSSDVAPHGIDSDAPHVTTARGRARVDCDFIVGADGYHGVCRPAIPGVTGARARATPTRGSASSPTSRPSTDDLIYALHPDGFAMHSMRSPEVSRLYLQVDPTESIDDWRDDRIWEQLQTRLGVDGWTLHEGTITEKSITPDAQLRRVDASSTAGCSWSATPGTSCRRPAPRGSTRRSPTSPCSAARSPRTTRGDDAPLAALQRPRRWPGSGRCSSSRSG